jgi:type IV pilus assembly protein PilP
MTRRVKRRPLQNRERKVCLYLGRPRAVKILFLFVFIALFLNFAGCESGAPPGPVPSKGRAPSLPKKTTDAAKSVEKKEPEKKEEVAYAYNPGGKQDPFKPFIQLNPVRESSRNVPLTPLQKYEISQLKLVAILSTPEGSVALVEDAAGKGYFLKKGTGIGQNEGRVTRILKDRVIVEEKYQDIFGQMKTNEVSIMLHRPEEGGES